MTPTPTPTKPARSRADARRRRDRLLTATVFCAALLLSSWAHRASFSEPYRVNNDSHQHIYWMQQFQRPELFQDDLLTLYARHYQPWGFALLYRALAFAVDPLLVSRILPLLLFALSAALVFRLVRRFADPATALLAAALFCVCPFFLQKMAGGHPRAFATPLLLLTLDLLVNLRPRALAAVLAVGSAFYPMAWLLCAATTVLTVGYRLVRSRQTSKASKASEPASAAESRIVTKQALATLALGLLLGGGLLVGKYVVARDPRIGPTVSGAEMRASPEVHAGGRAAHLPTPSLPAGITESVRRALPNPMLAARPRASRHLPPYAMAGVGLVLVYFTLLVLRRRIRPPAPLVALAVASCGLYLAAEQWLFLLFLPRRYVMYSIPLLTILAIALTLGYRLRRLRPAGLRRLAQAAVLVGALLPLRGLDGVGLDDYSEYGELYRFLATLPTETLVAAPPYAADGVPLFARQRVFISYELSNPYFTTYWREVRQRIRDFFRAYTADDLTDVSAFCGKYGIGVLVTDARDFEPERLARGEVYFEPFGSWIRDEVGDRRRFALLEVPAERRLFTSSDGRFRALRCKDL